MKISRLIYSIILFTFMLSIINVNCIAAQDDEPIINTAYAILMDGNTGQILYKKNEDARCYPASITKLMTALLGIETLQPDDLLTFSQTAVYSIEYGSSHIGIQEGEILTGDQALHALLLMSANEVANGIAEKVSGSIETFAELMTSRAQELGALNSHFVNPHGLYDENHYTTPYDMALITKELLTKDYFLSLMKDTYYEIPTTNKVDEIRYLSQQHKMLNPKKDASIFREDVIGGKTGYTIEAGHTLVTIAQRNQQILIAVVMKSEGQYMYSDTDTLLDYGFDAFKTVEIAASAYEETVPITDQTSVIGEAIVQLKAPILVSLKDDQNERTITYKTTITAPLNEASKQGDVVGNSALYIGEDFIIGTDVVLQKINFNAKVAPTLPKNTTHTKPLIIILIFIVILVGALFYHHIQPKSHYSKYATKKKFR